MRIFASAVTIMGLFLVPSTVFGASEELPSGEVLVGQAAAKDSPIGFKAATIFRILKVQSFENNVAFSNAWITAQLMEYDAADPMYKKALAPMVQGGGEHGIGMRNWLTDKQNVAWWDKTVAKAVGEDGYARVVALNAGFSPGSKDYLLTYGFERKYDPAKDSMSLDGLSFSGVMNDGAVYKLKAELSPSDKFIELVKFGDPVRKQMFAFYEAFEKGSVTRTQVEKFNIAYVKSGGCAMAATDVVEPERMARYLNAVNQMAKVLSEIGFKS